MIVGRRFFCSYCDIQLVCADKLLFYMSFKGTLSLYMLSLIPPIIMSNIITVCSVSLHIQAVLGFVPAIAFLFDFCMLSNKLTIFLHA